jgi:predicted Zn-dependent protease
MRDYLRLSESDNMPINRGQLPLLIRAGLLKEATNLLSSLALKDEGILKVCEGQIALARSHTTEAIRLLEQGVTATKSELSWWFYYPGVESLATAHERQGDLAGSLRVLEEACREDEPRFGWFWKIELQLAQLYRTLNRIEDARRIEAKLFNQLRYADEDHPILVQLRRMQTK